MHITIKIVIEIKKSHSFFFENNAKVVEQRCSTLAQRCIAA